MAFFTEAKRAFNFIGEGFHKIRTMPENMRLQRELEEAWHKYEFIDRSHGSDKLCMILAGYKEPLWDDVFDRLVAVLPNDIDVCIMTSGKHVPALIERAEKMGWSYLSTEMNQLSLVQNITIQNHPAAKWLYKIDEDMFLTEGFFEKTMATFERVRRESLYEPCFVSPLINVSCYGYIRMLEKLGLVDDFKARFGDDIKYTDGLYHHQWVLENPEVAKYMWGDTRPELADIDALNERFSADGPSFSVCPLRYSIGAILFERKSWEEFQKFPVDHGNGLGADEERVCYHATFTGRAMVVDESCVAGHLGYGPQTATMIEYYKAHQDRYRLKTR